LVLETIFLVTKMIKFANNSISDQFRIGMTTGQRWVSRSHTHLYEKNSSPSSYLNPTGIKLLSHSHRVMGIFSYPYSYYLNMN